MNFWAFFKTEALKISGHLGWFPSNSDKWKLIYLDIYFQHLPCSTESCFVHTISENNYQFYITVAGGGVTWLDEFLLLVSAWIWEFHPAKILNPFLTLGWSAKYSFSGAPECLKSWWGQTLFGGCNLTPQIGIGLMHLPNTVLRSRRNV